MGVAASATYAIPPVSSHHHRHYHSDRLHRSAATADEIQNAEEATESESTTSDPPFPTISPKLEALIEKAQRLEEEEFLFQESLGLNMVKIQCRRHERKYVKCVRGCNVYNLYHQQIILTPDKTCQRRYDQYRSCVLHGIKRQVWDKHGYPPPSIQRARAQQRAQQEKEQRERERELSNYKSRTTASNIASAAASASPASASSR